MMQRNRSEARVNITCAAAIASGLALAATPSHAGYAIDQYVTVSGFGTLGVVHSDYDLADFAATVAQPRGAGYSRSWSPTPDSDLGAQANVSFTDALSGVVQVVSRENEDDNFKPEVEWANLKYDITPDLAVRIGRVLLPTYQRSEIQNVGYALPWVRIPVEITYTNTAIHNDGIDVLFRVKTAAVTQNLEAQWGAAIEDLPGLAFNSDRAHVVMFGDTLQYGDASLHLVYERCDTQGFPSTRLQLEDVGVTYDPGTWFVTEDANHTQDPYFGEFFAWYLSGGVHVGRFAPYATYSSLRAGAAGSSELKELGDEHSVSIGVRWDFARNFDLKLQLDRVTLDSVDDTASFANIQPSARIGDKANVLSLALDFVF
jgi:hypothetical protein